jgi:serine/threonine protein kinase
LAKEKGKEQESENSDIEIGGIEINKGSLIDGYRYDKPIGKGGMAEVLLGFDPSNRPVAIKVLKASRFRIGRVRFSREFRTLARMNHPNVIHVDSYGDIYGHPYIAMEYIEGSDLHKTIREFRNLPLAKRWNRVREVLTDIAKGLDHIHSHGLVHRDLKPSNILIDKKGRCVITDFGIVKELHTDVDASTTLVGTWAYASPEQISGQNIDHRSDLYSLGIILYAMICSRRPFAANNMAGYLKLHQGQPPKAPSDFIPEIPTLFEDICLKLLEKSPQDRYQSASEILHELGEYKGDSKPKSSIAHQIPFFDIELRNQLIQIIQTKTNQVTAIIGDEGFGKSRLLSELEKYLSKLNRPYVRIGMPSKQAPYESALKLINHIAKESASADLNYTLQMWSNATQKMEANLRYRLFDDATIALRSLLEERPQIILIDDIHLCQQPSYDFFLYLKSALMDKLQLPLFFFFSSKYSEHQFSSAESITLKELSEEQIKNMLTKMAPNQVNIELISQKIFNETDGIPQFLNAFIKQLLDEKVLSIENDQYIFLKTPEAISKQNFNIPPTIRQLSKQRLESLSNNQLILLKVLAVSGRALHINILLEIVEWEEEKTFDLLEGLIEERIIIEQKIGFDEYFSFTRRKLGEVLYEELQPNEQKKIHKELAVHLENLPLPSLAITQQIGEHYRAAEVASKAYSYLAEAALRLWERGLVSDALYNIQISQPLTRNAKLEMEISDFYKARLKTLQVRSAVAHNKGEWLEAIKYLKTQLRYAKELHLADLEAQTQLDIGDVLTRLGEVKDGTERINKVLKEGQKRNNVTIQVTAYHHLCAVAWMNGDLERCEILAQKGLDLLPLNDISLSKAKILLSISAINAQRGNLPVACEQMIQASKILERLTRKELLSIVLCNLSEVLLWRGMWEEALSKAQYSLELSENTMHKAGQAQALLIISMIHMDTGYYSKANVFVKKANHLAHTLQAADLVSVSNFILAQIQYSLENYTTAYNHLQQALTAAKKYDPEQYKSSIYSLFCLVLDKLNQPERADKIFQNLIRNLTSSIPPVRMAECFYLMAKRQIHHGDVMALDNIKLGDEISQKRGMWGWSLKLKSLLASSQFSTKEDSDSYQELLQQLCKNISPEQQSLLEDHLYQKST